MDTDARGINPVAMTIINPRKEYWLSRRFEIAIYCSQAFYRTNLAMGLGFTQKRLDVDPFGIGGVVTKG